MADTSVRTAFSISAAIKAGLIAGLVFLVMEMVLVATIGGGSPWGPPRMMAAIGMGNGVLPPPPTFDAGIVIVGIIIHFVLSVVLALIFAQIASRVSLSHTMLAVVGAIFGLVVYVVNFYGFTAIFPWFEMARNGITIASHIVFGLVLAFTYRPTAKVIAD